MIESITKAFNAYSKGPFLFVWASIMYIILLIASLFAAFGMAVAYFIALSVLNKEMVIGSIPTLAVFGIIALLFIFFGGGLNAALAKAYRSAYWKEKMSLTKFYGYALEKAPEMFGIQLVRELLWVLLAGPGIAIYIYMLKGIEFMDILFYAYIVFVTFMIHMIFTPAFISAGAFGMNLFSSMRHAFEFLRKRHVFFIAMFALFAVLWFLNFIPILQFITIFFAYPVLYTALIIMMEDAIKIKEEESDAEGI